RHAFDCISPSRPPLTPTTILFFFLVIPPPPRSTLFPYTTLFRSRHARGQRRALRRAEGGLSGAAAHRLRRRVLDGGRAEAEGAGDRKSTRLNSSHVSISYAVFCLKKKKK